MSASGAQMTSRNIVVVAASAGGVAVLQQVLPALPAELDAAVLIVVHTGPNPNTLPVTLAHGCSLPVRHPYPDEPIRRSVVYLAPPDRHLIVAHGRVQLTSDPKENFTRPAADPLFRSAAFGYGSGVVGVVLTGYLNDGAAGAAVIRSHGGFVIVQDPSDCVAPSMPMNALRAADADVVSPVDALGAHIVAAVNGSGR
jgi:two-component system chemotaxis response regulator CheB